MVSKDEIKKLSIAFGKKWFFPDFTNKLTWLVVSVGCGILVTPTPLKLLFYNWLVSSFNLNSGIPFNLADVQSDSASYVWGITLVAFGLAYNIIHKYISSPIAHQKNEKLEVADKSLFSKFLETLPSDSHSVSFLKEHDFENSYHGFKTEQIEKFVDEWNNTEHQFLNVELEQKKQELLKNYHSFLCKLAENSHPVNSDGLFSVIPEAYRGEYERPSFVIETIGILNGQATTCYNLHQKMVLLCRSKLMC